MRKWKWLIIAMLILGMSMASTLAGFASGTSFEVDCLGAHGVGDVPAGETYYWRVELRTPVWDGGNTYFQVKASVTGPAAFDVDVPWPALTTPTDWYGVFIHDSQGNRIYALESQLDCTPPPPGQGCTPGYWKNHLEDWPPTGYSPGDDFDFTFGVYLFDPDITLDEAVNAKGGGVKKLARHGTAALLSAAHPDVNYPHTVAEVIALVQAGDADTLVSANELGCEIP